MIDKVKINTTQNVNLNLKIAGIGERLIALIIDYFILAAISIITNLIIRFFYEYKNNDTLIIVISIVSFFVFLYHFFLEALMSGQTIGKRVQKIQVMHKSGREASVLNYFIRNLIRPIDMIYGIGALIMLLNKNSLRIGDFAAGTIVVKKDEITKLTDLTIPTQNTSYVPVFDKINVIKLNENDIEIINRVVNRPTIQMNWNLVEKTANRIKQKTNIKKTNLKNLKFLHQIVNDYNHYNLYEY